MIKPILDKVLVKPSKGEEKTGGGIILASSKKDQPVIATVIEVGPGGIVDGKEVKMFVHKGDNVLINKYSGTEFSYGGSDYLIVSQKDILGLVA
jgi:chaperonin GroES